MSTTIIEVLAIDAIEPHPNADRLEVATLRGSKVVIGKGTFSPGQPVAYFPPDILIPSHVSESLGVTKYLKHAVYDDGEGRTQCRVAGCRLRGQPSFGFVAPYHGSRVIGDDITDEFGGRKYTPPVRIAAGDAAPEHPLFHKYTEIENYQRYPTAIPDGTRVRITEKIHGTNVRVGLISGESGFELMAGSHRINRKRPLEGKACPYWEPLSDERLVKLLTALHDGKNNVIVFGESFGPGIQDLDYGVPQGKRGFRVFDISINGSYMNWADLLPECEHAGVETVPLLYNGPFSQSLIEQYTYGPTTLGEPRSVFKGREGIVITPCGETFSDVLGGRMILKSISADYLDRKGAEDNA